MSFTTARYLCRLVAIPRLREVRSLLGFTRIEAPELDPTMEVFNEEQGIRVTTAPISAKQLDWLPAVENLGEGIFLQLNTQRLHKWEKLEPVRQRAEALIKAYSLWRQKRGLPEVKDQRPRLLLLHTLAHLLMRQMSLDCGYSSASLRERIYSDDKMAGLLIYTSTPDSDGSLGGLVRQWDTSLRKERNHSSNE
ncbi:MAG: Zn-binding domain-containing protein [Microthrixaceae bacterium]